MILRSRLRVFLFVLVLVAAVGYYFCLPGNLFEDPYATVLEDYRGELLTAGIAPDGQWRFPETDLLPDKFSKAITTYEDSRFWRHHGVDPLALGRALRQNIQAGKIASGGSTLSMQVIRLSRKGMERTIVEKIIESILATRLELRYSKGEILAIYASHAPFGGNVVGIEAACWRYFGRQPESLSWAEAAMLAVLPNAPSLIHPGKNRLFLKRKRDALLDKLRGTRVIDAFTAELAKSEPIPEKPHALPQWSRHLMTRAIKDGKSQKKIRTTIQGALQQPLERIIQLHHERLAGNQIHNASAIIMDVETGSVLAYVGNIVDMSGLHGSEVDINYAPRSTGSILKPFLFAAMIDDGKILPGTLLPDIPTIINGFAPKNFSHQYDGAVPADQSLIRSLNVPAVYLLKDYRYERFYELLRDMGMKTLRQPADHYGLALILGGAEGTLWDITGMYASMARTLNHYFKYAGANRYDRLDFHAPHYDEAKARAVTPLTPPGATSLLSASSIYQTFDALKEVYRPGEETGWKNFSSSRKIAWKTGTSFGNRDGWAVGVTPEYAVGVWVGNADGEGRPGLTGTETAAPILFDIFSHLPGDRWFEKPLGEMVRIDVCGKSGYRVGPYCTETATQQVNRQGLTVEACPYHVQIHLSNTSKHRVHSGCSPLSMIRSENWFVLPPVQEYYYKSSHISYVPLPPFLPECVAQSAIPAMDVVYPKPNSRIFIPRELDGNIGKSVFEVAHRSQASVVYWHIDNEFIGATEKVHQLAVQPALGRHKLTIVDGTGETLTRYFEVISAM